MNSGFFITPWATLPTHVRCGKQPSSEGPLCCLFFTDLSAYQRNMLPVNVVGYFALSSIIWFGSEFYWQTTPCRSLIAKPLRLRQFLPICLPSSSLLVNLKNKVPCKSTCLITIKVVNALIFHPSKRGEKRRSHSFNI